MVHGASSLISSVILSITIANKQGLRADPCCSPTVTSNPSITPTARTPHRYCTVLVGPYIITLTKANNSDMSWHETVQLLFAERQLTS